MVTAALWPAIIGAVGAILAAALSVANRRKIESNHADSQEKINEIHVMVDGRLDAALNEIKDLKTELTYEKEQHHHAPIEEVIGDAEVGHDHDDH